MRRDEVLNGLLVSEASRRLVHRWGEDASSSQAEQPQQAEWWDENSWDGYAGDDGDDSEAMNLQELEFSLLEAGYAAAGARRHHHHHHHHHHRDPQGEDGGSESGEATTSNRTIPESSLPCMAINSSSTFDRYEIKVHI